MKGITKAAGLTAMAAVVGSFAGGPAAAQGA
jgi:hypothetical protein